MDFNEMLGVLQGGIAPKEKEVNLKTLSKNQKAKIMRAYKNGRDFANSYYSDTIEPSIIKRQEVYDAPVHHYRKKFPLLSELTDWLSRDVKTTIDWMIPSLMECFTGSDDPCDIRGVNVKDDARAERVLEVVRYQTQRKNNLFLFLYNFIREGLITNEGVCKIYWRRDEERTEMEVMVDMNNIQEYIQQAMMGQIEIKEVSLIQNSATDVTEYVQGGQVTSYASPTVENIAAILKYDKIEVKYNAPVLENMSPSELRFTPDGRSLAESKFVAHRKIVKGDYLKRKEEEGVFRDVSKAIKDAGDNKWTDLDIRNNHGLDEIGDKLSDDDDASKDIELFEAYLDVDYNNDGKLEHLIVTAVGDIPIAIQENTSGCIPFFLFAPEHDPYTPFGKASYADILEQLQDLKTALVRQLIIAIGKNNRPQRFVDADKVDMDALINQDEIVPCTDIPSNSVFIPHEIPISQLTMSLIDYAQNEIESQSGSTKYNQGLDSNSLNKTATGINAIMGAADKKMKLIARIFAETVWLPIIKHIIRLNQEYLDPYQQIRLADDMVPITREDMDVDYDLSINTAQGAGTKEAQMNYLIMIMQQLWPTLQQVGLVDEHGWYEVSKNLLEKMGIRNVSNYILDPDGDMFKQKQASAQQEAQRKEQQEMQLKQAELEAKMYPKLSANYKDLPVDAKIQALEKYAQLHSTPVAVAEKEIRDTEKRYYDYNGKV